jgi:aspartate/tyrosine/aromatic aminotransferase
MREESECASDNQSRFAHLLSAICTKAEQAMLDDASMTKEYLPILGLPAFRTAAQHVLLTPEVASALQSRMVTSQALSGTGALRLALDTLRTASTPQRQVLVSNPTWNNHKNLITLAGLTHVEYRYLDTVRNALDLASMLADLDAAPVGSIVILHACAHNPTGIDATEAQWRDIARVIQAKRHLPLFDVAYQGYVSGDPKRDGVALRLFAALGIDMVVCQSFSKNLGLYSERIGAAHFIVSDTPTPPSALPPSRRCSSALRAAPTPIRRRTAPTSSRASSSATSCARSGTPSSR